MGNEIFENEVLETTEVVNETEEVSDVLTIEEVNGIQAKPPVYKQKMKRETKRRIFYWCWMVFPIIQLLMFYFYVNATSWALSFQIYYRDDQSMLQYDWGFTNFEGSFDILFSNLALIRNSAINYLINFATGMGLGTLFSFYVYKEYPMATFFKVMLFMPSLISGVILALIFKFLVTDVYIEITEMITGVAPEYGLYQNVETEYWTLLIYNVWVGFGGHVILMTGAMSGINDSLVEAAELDGINSIKEFWYITLPMIYPTIITFTITGMAGFFMNDMSAYTVFGDAANQGVMTFGYKFFVDTKNGGYVPQNEANMSYGQVSALGLCFSLVTLVVMTSVKKCMEKFGPSVY